MTPLNHLINYSSELTQRTSFFQKNVASRCITAVSIPCELLAILENTIRLPFQTISTIIKIPAKIINVVIASRSLKEFESKLSSPLDVITTAIKIAGFAIGLLFTSTLGLLSPHKNFRLHCSLSLVDDFHAQKLVREAKESRQKEIDSHEKIIERRLIAIIEAMRKQSMRIDFLTDEQRQEIQALTGIECPALEELFQEAPVEEIKETIEIPEEETEVNTIDDDLEPITNKVEIEEVETTPENILPDTEVPVNEPTISVSETEIFEDLETSEEITTDNDDDSKTVIPFEYEQLPENQDNTLEEGIELVNGG